MISFQMMWDIYFERNNVLHVSRCWLQLLLVLWQLFQSNICSSLFMDIMWLVLMDIVTWCHLDLYGKLRNMIITRLDVIIWISWHENYSLQEWLYQPKLKRFMKRSKKTRSSDTSFITLRMKRCVSIIGIIEMSSHQLITITASDSNVLLYEVIFVPSHLRLSWAVIPMN